MKSGKNWSKLVAVIIFVFVLVIPVVGWPLFNLANNKVDENRNPSPFPNFNNEFFMNLDKFILDRVPLRGPAIKLYSKINLEFAREYEKFLNLLGINVYTERNNVVFGKDDWLFYYGDYSLEYYRGSNLLSIGELEAYCSKLKKVDNYFKSQGKEFRAFIAPNKEQIYTEFMPDGVKVENEVKRIDALVNFVEENSGIKIMYPKQVLLNEKQNQQIYYKQDTHWNPYGAYLGACEILKSLNIDIGSISPVEMTRNIGDLAMMNAQQAIEDIDYQMNYRNEINLISDFKDQAFYCSSSNPNGKNLFLFGDSFRNDMVPILGKEFTNSIFVHRDNFTDKERYKKQIEDADVIVFEMVERYDWTYFADGGMLDRFIQFYNL